MKYVYFQNSGRIETSKTNVFLCCLYRLKTRFSSFYSRNDLTYNYRIPETFFKRNFKYNRFSGVYANNGNISERDMLKFIVDIYYHNVRYENYTEFMRYYKTLKHSLKSVLCVSNVLR